MRRIASRHAGPLIALLLCACATTMDLLAPDDAGGVHHRGWREAAWAREP